MVAAGSGRGGCGSGPVWWSVSGGAASDLGGSRLLAAVVLPVLPVGRRGLREAMMVVHACTAMVRSGRQGTRASMARLDGWIWGCELVLAVAAWRMRFDWRRGVMVWEPLFSWDWAGGARS